MKIYDDMESNWELFEDNYESIIPEEFRWRNWADTTNEKGMKGEELLKFIDTQLFPTLQNLPIPQNCPRRKSIVKAVFEDIHNYMKDGVLLRQVIEVINDCDFSDPKESHAFGTIYETILKELQSAGSSGEFYTPRALTDFMAQHVNLKIGEKIADFACGTGGFLNSARKFLEPQAVTIDDRVTLSSSFFGIEKKPLPHLLCVTNMLLNGVEDPNIQHGNSLLKNVSDFTEKDKFDVILMNPPYGGSEQAIIQQNFPENMRSAETADLFMILIMKRLKTTGRAAVIIPDGFLFGGGNKTEIRKELLKKYNLHTIVRLPTSVFSPYTSIATNVIFFDGKGPTKETWVYRVDMPEGYKHFSKTKPMLLEHLSDLATWWTNRQCIEIEGNPKAQCYTPDDFEALNYNFDVCGFPQEEEEILPPHELIEKYKADRAKQQRIIDEALSKIFAILESK